MEHKKGEKRVLAHSRTKNGQEIVKINSLSLGLTLSAFTSGCSATSCAMFFSLLHFEQFLKLCLQVYKSSLLQCLNNCSFCPVKFSFQIFFISRNSFGYYLPISFILMFMFSSKSVQNRVQLSFFYLLRLYQGFPGGSVAKNPSAIPCTSSWAASPSWTSATRPLLCP